LRLRQNVLGNGKRMSSSNGEPSTPQKSETRLVTAGRDTKGQRGFVNPAVFHGSTVLYPTAEDLHAHRAEFSYRRHGSPTTRALQDVLMSLEARNARALASRRRASPRSPPPCSRC
jgi:cystathionine beta-lyase/cystathionine gamma-synthase